MAAATSMRERQGRAAGRIGEATIALEPWQWGAVRRGAAAVILGLAGAQVVPAGWAPPRWPLGLQRFTIMLELHWQTELPAEIPESVLARAAARWPHARDLAALLRSRVPRDHEVAGVAGHLRRLAESLRGEGHLAGVGELALAIAEMLDALGGAPGAAHHTT